MPSIICGKVDDKTKTIMANFICDNGKTKANPKI